MKVFGIGLERTGTWSLCGAMAQLGYQTCHFPVSDDEIAGVDFSNDITVAFRFAALDQRYPGSKFILTTRESVTWLDSCARWYGGLGQREHIDNPPGHEALTALYGTTHCERNTWLEGKRQHHWRVRSYFVDRPNDLLELNLCGGQGWETLCPWLGCAVINQPFPHDHKGLLSR
jgi:hypothetical protein